MCGETYFATRGQLSLNFNEFQTPYFETRPIFWNFTKLLTLLDVNFKRVTYEVRGHTFPS